MLLNINSLDMFKILCEFHHKQCNRKQMLKFEIPTEEITKLIGPLGHFDVLYVLPPHEIETLGIPYVRRKMNEGSLKPKWDKYWAYFIKTTLTFGICMRFCKLLVHSNNL